MNSERSNVEAGNLDRLVTVQVKGVTMPDTRGHPVRGWSDLVSNVWAKIETPQGRKLEMSRQLVSDCTHTITMRWRIIDEDNHRLTYAAPVATLAAAIATTTAQTITVNASSSIPLGSVLVIGSEKLLVTGLAVGDTGFLNSVTLTVTRGYESSTAATHLSGVIVRRRRVFNIGHAENVEERNVSLVLTCTEVKGATSNG